MTIKYRQALVAVGELLESPFDSSPSVRLVDAMGGSWLLRTLYGRMAHGLSDEARAKLGRLTREPIDIEGLRSLPPDSFGYHYGAFLHEHGLSASAVVDIFPPIGALFDRDWIPWRSAKLHDMHHFLLDFPLTPRGEMALQLFNLRNFREPWGVLAMLSLPLVLVKYGEPRLMLGELRRAWELSARAENLWSTPFEELYAMKITEVRARLGLDPRL